jgi:hypothetical protein
MPTSPSSSRHRCQAGKSGAACSSSAERAYSNPMLADTCRAQAELQQLLSPEDIQSPLNPRNEAAALALLLTNAQS